MKLSKSYLWVRVEEILKKTDEVHWHNDMLRGTGCR